MFFRDSSLGFYATTLGVFWVTYQGYLESTLYFLPNILVAPAIAAITAFVLPYVFSMAGDKIYHQRLILSAFLGALIGGLLGPNFGLGNLGAPLGAVVALFIGANGHMHIIGPSHMNTPVIPII